MEITQNVARLIDASHDSIVYRTQSDNFPYLETPFGGKGQIVLQVFTPLRSKLSPQEINHTLSVYVNAMSQLHANGVEPLFVDELGTIEYLIIPKVKICIQPEKYLLVSQYVPGIQLYDVLNDKLKTYSSKLEELICEEQNFIAQLNLDNFQIKAHLFRGLFVIQQELVRKSSIVLLDPVNIKLRFNLITKKLVYVITDIQNRIGYEIDF